MCNYDQNERGQDGSIHTALSLYLSKSTSSLWNSYDMNTWYAILVKAHRDSFCTKFSLEIMRTLRREYKNVIRN